MCQDHPWWTYLAFRNFTSAWLHPWLPSVSWKILSKSCSIFCFVLFLCLFVVFCLFGFVFLGFFKPWITLYFTKSKKLVATITGSLKVVSSYLEYLTTSHRILQEIVLHMPVYRSSGDNIISSGIFLHRHRHAHFFSKSCTVHNPYSGNSLFRTIWNSTSHRQCQKSVNFKNSLFLIYGCVNCQEATGPRHSAPQQYAILQSVAHSCHCKLILQSHHLEQLVSTHQFKAEENGNSVVIPVLFWHCKSRSLLLLMTTTAWKMGSPWFPSQP